MSLTLAEIQRRFAEYDASVRHFTDQGFTANTSVLSAGLDPTQSLMFHASQDRARVNTSDLYWHQRLNNDPCWQRVAMRDFDQHNDGMFRNISQYGFYKTVTAAMSIHRANLGIIVKPNIRTDVQTSTSSSFVTKTVTTTVRYWLSPSYTVVTPKGIPGLHSEFVISPNNSSNNLYSFISVQGEHNFPVDETLIHQWSQSQSGWTSIFIFVVMVVVGAFTGGAGLLNVLSIGTLQGAGLGAIGSLIATGGNVNTTTVARFTPFVHSAYELQAPLTGHGRTVADNTFNKWLRPEVYNTPGGMQVFVQRIDFRRAALCGGAHKATDDCLASPTSSIVEIPMGDPRFQGIWDGLWRHESHVLQRHRDPFIRQ